MPPDAETPEGEDSSEEGGAHAKAQSTQRVVPRRRRFQSNRSACATLSRRGRLRRKVQLLCALCASARGITLQLKAYFQNQPGLSDFALRFRHIFAYISRPEKLKNTMAKPDSVAITTPRGPNSSPECRWCR